MRIDASTRMEARTDQRLIPRIIQSMEILQLSLPALQERIDREFAENPTLVDPREEADAEIPSSSAADSDSDSDSDSPSASPDDDYGTDDYDADYDRDGPSRSAASLAEASDQKMEAMLNMASRPPSLQDYLGEQLGYLDLEPTVRACAEHIIENLDERGYFLQSLEDVARAAAARLEIENSGAEHEPGERPRPPTVADAERALQHVQRFDPPGIAARDLRECLLLQITPDIPDHETLRLIVANHLDDVEHNRLPVVERKLGIPIDRIKEALEHLRRFTLRPASRFETRETAVVVPDLVVELDERGEYRVRLAKDQPHRLGISRQYRKLARDKHADPVTRDFIRKKIQSAQWLIESVEKRRETLLKVATAIIERQKEFLDKGERAIQPLKMEQIAERVGVHVTTVSRAVDDKWIQTPRGLFPLKRFFGGGTTTADGDEVAYETLRQKLREIVANEDKAHPLSDEDIAREFAKEGVTLARRTITKYREEIGIPSSRVRRRH